MKQFFIILIFFLTITVGSVHGQDTLIKTKYLSLGTRSSGICFGNSIKYDGIRLNLWDKEFERENSSGRINGINISFRISNNVSNGVEFGILSANSEKVSNGIQLSVIAATSNKVNGIALGLLGVHSNKINGTAIGGFYGVNADTLNGMFFGISGVGSSDKRTPNKIINGFAMGLLVVGAEQVNGMSCALAHCYSKQQNGISIAIYNRTENLHGLQLGLLNYARNNPKLIKWMPIMNFHR